ncbi:MAG: TIGR02281 family clan AA aspartic protease [Alphaproteobacteria bacterium]|nr:TIGR02281 family clan AA aspartic protease [Alphaproteobacteria bacterium]
MSNSPWRVPDSENQEPARRSGRPSPVLRLTVFLLGMALLVFGLSLAFPATSMIDPYLVRGLVILLIFGGAAAFWSRSSLVRLVKMAGLWVLIITGIATFYLYRSDLGNRFMSAIDPAGVVSTGEELLVHRSRDGHFWLKARLNGVSVRFMVDTGASNIVLSPDDARSAGINVGILDFSGRASTANGEVPFAKATVTSLRLADHVFYDVPVTVNGADMDGSLLGMAVLNRFSSVEFRGDMLILRP